MCLTIRKIGLGDDVQSLWNAKKAEGYSYQKLPDNKLFFNFFRLSKDNENVIIGSNKKNEVSMFVYSESIPSANINDIYVKYLEFLFKNRYAPMPEHLKKSFPVNDDFQLLNGAMSSNGDFVLLGKSKDTHDLNRDIWMSIVGSPLEWASEFQIGHDIAARLLVRIAARLIFGMLSARQALLQGFLACSNSKQHAQKKVSEDTFSFSTYRRITSPSSKHACRVCFCLYASCLHGLPPY